MSFDAGAVQASLTLDSSQFTKELDAAKAKVKALEAERHTVKISAVFDSSATARARQVFARLDQQLSADALARLKTSPQGSVLGSLNALLAPQSQSLQQGSIGNIARPGGTVTQQAANVARDVTTTDRLNVVGNLPQDNEITTLDRVTAEGLPPEHSDITTVDHVKVEGEVPKDGGTITTTDKVVLDEASAAEVKAELDAIGAKKETVSVGVSGAPETAAALGAVSAAAKDTSTASGGLSKQLGVLATPMGALVAAGVALSPVIVTAGVGLGGFGAAAVGAVKPILDAAQATGGLSGNLQTLDPAQQQAARGLLALEDQYNSFSKALAPEVFSVFNTGLKTASTLLGDVQPVAVAAGKGLDSVLNAVNTDLNSAEWKQFFTWMAQNAAPDIQMLGTTIGALVNDLPPLLEALQPVGVAFLGLTTDTAKLLDGTLKLGKAFKDSFTQPQQGNWLDWLTQHIPAGNKTLLDLFNSLLNTAAGTDKVTSSTDKAAAAQRAAVTAATDLSTNLTTLEARYGLSAAQAQALVTAAGQTDKALQGSGSSADGAMSAITKYADASLNAVTPSQQLAGAISTLNNNTLGATIQLSAFTTAWNILVGNSVSDQQAVLNTAQAFDGYNSAVKSAGQNSTAAQTAFLGIITSMGTGLSTLQQNGASIDTINGFYQTNIDKLNALHGLTPQQRADVQSITRDYDQWANSTDGLNSKLVTASGTIKDNFTAGLKALGEYTPKLGTDIDNLSNSILKTGTTSSATKGDRAALIKDLENAGLDADRATSFVDGLEKKIGGLKGKTVPVGVTATGSGKITATENILGEKSQTLGNLTFVASGGRMPGFGGGDIIPAMLEPGEAVVDKYRTRQYAPLFKAMGVPGFAAGGVAGELDSMVPFASGSETPFPRSAANAAAGDFMSAFLRAASGAVQAAAGPGGGAPAANAALARKLYPQYAAGPVWDAWNSVATAESGWNNLAVNPSSGAYGIPQALPYTKMPKAAWPASAGGSSNPTAQIQWMFDYMASVYGGPIGAWDHEQAFHWYGDGGMINEPVLGTGLRSGDRYVLGENGSEVVTPIGGARGASGVEPITDGLSRLEAKLDRLIDVNRQIPAGVGQHVGSALGGTAHDASFRARYPR